MATISTTAPFQNALKPCPRRSVGPQRHALVCRAQAGEADWSKKLGVHLLAAGIALTATFGQCHIADAGVILEQPKSKKLFQGSKRPPAPKPAENGSSGPSLPSVSLPSVSLPSVSLPSVGLPSVSLPGLPAPDLSGLNGSTSAGIDPRSVALPGAIVGIAGLGFAAYSLDSGFRSMMREGLVKDSNDYAGYEEAIDDYATQAAGAASRGTKKISKATKKGAQKAKSKARGAAGGGGGLGGLFGGNKK